MKRVLKYPLDHTTRIQVSTNGIPKILLISQQYPQDTLPTIWVETDDSHTTSHLTLAVFGTGQDIPQSYVHVGSCICGPLVWHVYRVAI